ncbi:MAG: mechanosensitive ion channel [Planctomycetales bacterium]|nr:mechanosensitive ion channel [Planctomycetales bacterium]MCA9171865.1 mechanosensitive ion channel [Planctomycetales bacterium]
MYTTLLADLNVPQRLQEMVLGLKDNFNHYIIQNGPDVIANVVMAAGIFYVGRWGARLAERALDRVLTRAKIDETLSKFLCRIAYAIIMVNVVLTGLGKLGINTGTVTAIFAAAGLAVGLALQGSLSNFAAGVLMIILRPLKVGDFVEAAGTKGIIEEINVFNTIMRTPDNIEITVPNASITGGNITNYSTKPTRRIDLLVGCGYNDDLLAVKRFLEQLVASDPRILRDPTPVVAVSELGDNSVNFVVRPWVVNANYWAVRWDLTEKIKLGFDQLGFTIPFPQRDLHIHAPAETSALGAPAVSALSNDTAAVRPRRAA